MRTMVCVILLLCSAAVARAQNAQTAVVPETITVGDVFHAAVRVNLPDAATLIIPDSLELPADVENAGRPELRIDSTSTTRVATILFPLAAWRPGSYQLPTVSLRLVNTQGQQTVRVRLPDFEVRSVLPVDTAGIEMKGLKDVWGPDRIWWPWLLAALLALIALLVYLWWRRRKRGAAPVVIVPSAPAHEIALARLDALRRSDLLARGEMKRYYDELAETLRRYAAAIEPEWGVDLTTSELTHRVRARDASLLDVIRILGSADLVKFARARPPVDLADRDLDAARAWIERTRPRETTVEAATPTEPRRVA